MPRLALSRIARPAERPYRSLSSLRGDRGELWFETSPFARLQDKKRAIGLRFTAARADLGPTREHLLKLAGRLEKSATHDRIPRTLSSSRYMRKWRGRIIGNIWRLVATEQHGRVTTVTIIPRGWEFSAGELDQADPVLLLARLRTALNRCGAATASGYFIGFVDGEYERSRRIYQLHVHAIVAGEMTDVVDGLRKTTACKSTNSNFLESGETVRQRIKMAQKPLTDLAYLIGYQLKGFWLQHRAEVGPSGWLVREERGTKILEPQHSEVLLWLDRWSLNDISLLVNVAVGRSGLVVKKPKNLYMKGGHAVSP